ncbi:DUF171-domain-containing protein [Aspergillus ambiguus]|uniref:DUF171-domain-containing protein n=1 Tax=Aspergillus ambiguus TaxID=176160 RepID=UPI003CCD27B9
MSYDNNEWPSVIASISDSLPDTFPTYPADASQINRTIDHTLLAVDATPAQIDTLCEEAIAHQFATVCVRLAYVQQAAQKLQSSPDVGVACVVGFHEGTHPTANKAQEAREAVQLGASELDMVLNYPLLKERRYREVYDDVVGVRTAAPSVRLKVILETSQLSRDEIIASSVIACMAGADYIKTSTGFNGPGARVDDVALMRATAEKIGRGTRVKASGGVRTREDCLRMVEVGAERIGRDGHGARGAVERDVISLRPHRSTFGRPCLLPSLDHTMNSSSRSNSKQPLSHPPSVMRRPNTYKKQKTSHSPPRDGCSLFTAKPTAVFSPSGGRTHTLSVAIPGSIVANAHSIEQKTLLAGIIARALAVFCVDEVVVFDDEEHRTRRNDVYYEDDYDSPIAKTSDELNTSTKGYTANSDPSHFLAHLLSYLETPPYLRKHLFPRHPNLRGAGLLPSLDMPHHLRANEWCDYREGIVLSSPYRDVRGRSGSQMSLSPNDRLRNHSPARNHSSTSPDPATTVVDTGLPEKVVLPDIQLPEHARVTVRFSPHGHDHYAEPVHPSAPRAEAGYYWGYYVRRCRSLSSVFTECPFDGGYDLSFGTSERGAPVGEVLEDDGAPYRRHAPHHRPDYQHLLVVFGGVAGIEAAIRNDPQLRDMDIRPTDAGKLFDYWINLLPGQGSRTIRTEEAVWLGLTSLRGLVEGTHRAKRSYRYNGS